MQAQFWPHAKAQSHKEIYPQISQIALINVITQNNNKINICVEMENIMRGKEEGRGQQKSVKMAAGSG
jgi:hypothetical protein